MIEATSQMHYRLDNLNRTNERVTEQMSTGKKIEDGSDDTLVYTQYLYTEEKVRTYEGLSDQITKTKAINNSSDSAVKEIKNIIDSIKLNLQKSLNASTDPTIKKGVIATELKASKDTLLTLMNESVDGQYFFAGSNSTIRPFVEDPVTKEVSYQGDGLVRKVAVDVNTYRERGITGVDLAMYNADRATGADTLTFNADERVFDSNGLEWKLNAGKTAIEQYDINGDLTGNTLAVASTDTSVTPNVYTTANVVDILPDTPLNDTTVLYAKHNIFDDIDKAIDALNNNDDDEIGTQMENMVKAFDAANIAHSNLGTRNKVFENAEIAIESKITHFTIMMQETSGADLTKLSMQSKALELTYTALYSTINKMNNLSLVNFVK
jgi:flagellar hook-associated protein 3 FlgL